jgi:hypothetical protein
MKAALLYATTDRSVVAKCDGLYQQVYVSGWGGLFVRAELVEVNDMVETLDLVNCRPGENFLNGTPLDGEAKAS